LGENGLQTQESQNNKARNGNLLQLISHRFSLISFTHISLNFTQKIFKFASSPSAKLKSYRVALAEKEENFKTIM